MTDQSLCVLLVDDEASLRKPLARILREQCGYIVDEAESFQQALEKVETRSESFDVALIDDMIIPSGENEPEPLGIELMKAIRDRSQITEFILFTGWGLDSGLEAMRQGAYRYIRKPFDIDELAFMIEYAAEYRKLKEGAHERLILRNLMKSGVALLSGSTLEEILQSIANGVHALGFDRIRLYLWDEESQCLIGQAHVGMESSFVGFNIPLNEDQYMQRLLKNPQSTIFRLAEGEIAAREKDLGKENVIEWACVPLILHDQVIGKISADNKETKRRITSSELDPISIFAIQAAAAIENTRLRQQEHEASLKAEWRARKLEAIQEVSEALNENLNLTETLEVACRAAVELFDVDHSGLVLFDPNLAQGVVKAEFPKNINTVGTIIQVDGVSDEENLVRSKRPLVIYDVANQQALGPVRDTLRGFGIESILVVPMIFNDRIIGSFSLDAIGRKRRFSQDEIDLCMILAGQVASAVDNAQMYEVTREHADYWRQFMTNSPTAVIANDLQGRVIGLNRRAEAILGYRQKELLGQPVGELYFRPEEAHNIGNRLRASADGRIADYEALLRSKTDQPVSVRLAVTWLRDALGQTVGALGHFEDIQYLDAQLRIFAQSAIYQRISDSIQSAEGLSEVFLLILTSVTAGFGVGLNRAAIFLREPDEDKLVGKMGVGHLHKHQNQRVWDEFRVPELKGSEFFRRYLRFMALPRTPIGDRIADLGIDIDPDKSDVFSQVIQSGHWQRLESPEDIAQLPRIFREKFEPQAPLVVVALRSRARVIGLLVADNRFTRDPISNETVQSLISFANTAAIAIDNAKLLDDTKRQAIQLERVRQGALRVANQVEQAPLLEEIITRAVRLLDAQSGGVYEYDREQEELTITADFPGNRGVVGQVLKTNDGMAGRLVQSERPYLATADYSTSIYQASNFREGHPFGAVIEVPLRWRKEIVGVLYVDDKIGRNFGVSDANLLQMFADHAATALVNAKTLTASENARRELRGAFEAAVTLTAIGTPEQVLEDAVERAWKIAHAEWVSVVLIDNRGHARNLLVKGEGGVNDVDRIVRKGSKESISRQVIDSGIPEVIENVETHHRPVNQYMKDRGVRAALCLPFAVHDERIGVMWIHYNEPRRFQSFEVDALQLFANQAAVAYDNSQRIETLENLHESTGKLTAADSLGEVLGQITASAVQVLRAKSAAVWSFDEAKEIFLIEESTAAGISEDNWHAFRKAAPRVDGTATMVMDQGWIGVEDILDEKSYPFLGATTARRLRLNGVRSFQGVCLRTGDEKLGVLYINYGRPRGFTEEEKRITLAFADYAALALKKERLRRRVREAHATARLVAEMTVLQGLENTLESVVMGTKEVLRCDAVVLYAYDAENDRFDYPPRMTGVNDPDMVNDTHSWLKSSLVFKILNSNRPYIDVPNTSKDPMFMNSDFSRREEIKSLVAVPLRVGDEREGVMFINYRQLHRFTDDELTDIQLFANQAAVAIHDEQLFEKADRRAGVLEALNRAGRIVTGSLDSDETLKRLVEQAWHLAGDENRPVNFACIRLIENNAARLVSAFPAEKHERLRECLTKEVDLEEGVEGRIGIMGRAARTGISQLVGDVENDPDYLKCHPATHSDLAVPIKIDGHVIGVINVEHPEKDAFDYSDKMALEALAAQAAVALDNARQYRDIQEIKGYVGSQNAVDWMRMVASSWGHSINREVGEALAHVKLLKNLMGQNEEMLREAEQLERKIKEIENIPITEPLTSDGTVQSLDINSTLKQYFERRWKKYRYNEKHGIELVLDLQDETDQLVNVRASKAWMRELLTILTENAVQAMEGSSRPDKTVIVGSWLVDNHVQISIRDTGRGIPSPIAALAFKGRIPKEPGEKGSGSGLLQALAIVKAFGGDINVVHSDSEGTEICFRLPCEKPRGKE
ncbi:MAG: GAF domain-containing protein [Chloroflexota bacterium]|nr:GAF domain-containing protein [Chloroflexota bacterium]